jgi:hypothetical protein
MNHIELISIVSAILLDGAVIDRNEDMGDDLIEEAVEVARKIIRKATGD